MSFPRRLNYYSILIVTATFILITANTRFFDQVTTIYPFSKNIFFLIMLAIFVASLLLLLMGLLSIVLPTRWTAVIFLFLSAITANFTDNFGTIIDTEMIRNSLETNLSEAGDLTSGSLLLRIIFLGILPAGLLLWLPYSPERWTKKIVRSGILMCVSIAVLIVCLLSNSSQFASFFREHKPVRYYVNPTYPIYSMGRYLIDKLKAPVSNELISLQTQALRNIEDEHHELVIMVVGETARADHFSLNGYARNTNFYTSKETRLISYPNIQSCGTSTAISVPCMFSYQGHADFDVDESKRTENILDLLKTTGVHILWRDNNSDSKGMATRISYEDFRNPETNKQCDTECRDLGMLDGLQDFIDTHSGDIFIVLHQMGSHGPAYYKRYPKEFEHFTPACQTAELSECTQQEIINAYDNSIRYTDYFLSKIIALLKNNTPQYETAMLYISDHGESLGENGLYLHGMPYQFAPKTQTNVPALIWVSESSDIDFEKTKKLKDRTSTHDMIFGTLLELFEVTTDLTAASNAPITVMKDEFINH